jgi:hypothetical protein
MSHLHHGPTLGVGGSEGGGEGQDWLGWLQEPSDLPLPQIHGLLSIWKGGPGLCGVEGQAAGKEGGGASGGSHSAFPVAPRVQFSL